MTKDEQKLIAFKQRAEVPIATLQSLIDEMPFKGLKCENSQQVCLQQTLNTLERQIDSITLNDLSDDNTRKD